MKITAFNFEDYLCYPNTGKIDLSEKINVFIGENNSGKSAVLKAFYGLMAPSELNAKQIRLKCKQAKLYFNYDGKVTDFFNFKEDRDKIYDSLVGEEHYEEITDDAPSDMVENNKLKIDYLAEKFQRKIISVSISENVKNVSLISSVLDRFVEDMTFEIIFNTERPKNFIIPIFANRKTNQYSTDVSIDYYKKIETGFYSLPALIDKATDARHNEKFQKYTKEILGIKVYTSHDGGRGKNIKLIIDDGNELDIENLGDGIPIVIALIANLVLGKNKLYLIEEIENDLHPKALKKVLEMIVEFSDKNQFILTTHSNIVLQQLGAIESTKIFEVQKDKAKTIPTSSIVEIKGEQERRRVLHDLGYEMEDFGLWEAWLLLEEASAETIIRNYIIPLLFPKLKNKLRTFSCGGISKVKKKFERLEDIFVYLDLEKQYHNKVWVIIDSGKDETSDEKKLIAEFIRIFVKGTDERLKQGKPLWDVSNFIMLSKHDFEEYYPKEFKSKDEINEILTDKDKREKKELLLSGLCDFFDKKEEPEQKRILRENFQELINKIKIIQSKIIH